MKRGKKMENKIDDFDQAMTRLHRSPDGPTNQQRDNISNKNMVYSGSQHQITATKKMTGSVVGTLRE
jgi:hypothetical protein